MHLGSVALVFVVLAECSTGGATQTIAPGCLGYPSASCSGYPEGTDCPGPPTVCVSCGMGVYTLSESLCICTSGTWRCAPPASGQVQCTSPIGQYVDPACTVLYPVPDATTDVGPDG
jgi:hypothetical protein